MAEVMAPLTRRRLLSTATLGGVGVALDAGFPVVAYAQDAFDMIIIGGGTAGIPCAIFAAEQGAKVLIIEKSDQIGGTLWLTGGSMAAAGTRVQARQNIKDSPEDHYQDIMRLGHSKAVPELVRCFVDNAAAMADWLEDIGFNVRAGDPVAGRAFGHAAFSIKRYFQGPERGRSVIKVLLPVLRKHVDSGAVRLATSTGVAEIVVGRNRSARGVIAVGPDGARRQISARKVVIASGGYCHSQEMFKTVTGLDTRLRLANYMSQGDGLLLGQGAGGFIRGGEHQILNAGVLNDRSNPTVWGGLRVMTDQNQRPQWEIRVNKTGERFMREDEHDRDLADMAFTRQPTQRMWVIYDQAIADKAPPILREKSPEEVAFLFANHPMFFREASLDALAVRTGIDAATLKRTIEQYNSAVQNQRDTLGREFLPSAIGQGPFYAIEMSGGNIVGFGGLAINRDLQIIRKDGSPIKNLYAAGEVIGLSAIAGNAVVGGTGVTPSLTFGRLIGLNAMKAPA